MDIVCLIYLIIILMISLVKMITWENSYIY
jgi:hypothetical protein